MRKVKAVATLAAMLATVLLSGIAMHAEAPASIVGQDDTLAVATVPVTSTTSIETTAIVTTASSAAPETETTASSAETLLTAAETAAPKTEETTVATVQTTAAPVSLPPETIALPQTEAPAETESTALPENASSISVTEREYIMLCNVVGHEYGSDRVGVSDKALVVEVIMNRVHSPLFPNTIYGVLTQPGQFSGLEAFIYRDSFAPQVTDSVRAAVDLYLAHPEQFNHGYLYFTGDGTKNTFRQTAS